MTTLIAVAAVAAYVVADLFVARRLYGTWRARMIDKDKPNRFHDPVESFDNVDRPFVMMAAFAAALVWPFTLVCWGVYRFLDATPVRSRRELEVERKQMADRIRQLETELGIRH